MSCFTYEVVDSSHGLIKLRRGAHLLKIERLRCCKNDRTLGEIAVEGIVKRVMYKVTNESFDAFRRRAASRELAWGDNFQLAIIKEVAMYGRTGGRSPLKSLPQMLGNCRELPGAIGRD
jgi:hypothetical protein